MIPMERLKVIAGAGLAGAAVIAIVILVYNWGATPRLSGSVTEVRTLGMDERSSVAIINFEAVNTSDRLMIIHDRSVEVFDSGGGKFLGKVVSTPDLNDLFGYFPALGGMKDEPLTARTEIGAGERRRGLIAARFEIPKHELDGRQKLVLRFADGRGRASEVVEER